MLKINNIKKQEGKFLLECSLEVKSGQITGLVGTNGAGKTTLFKTILGLTEIDEGSIELMGKKVCDLTIKDRQAIGTVLSDSFFNPCFTIEDILRVAKVLYPAFDVAFFDEQVAHFGLDRNMKIKEYSTGMKAKLALIHAMSHDAKFLILDEPTSGLDVVARDELLGMLHDYMDKHSDAAVLISSHIASDLENLCDDIYLLDNGKIVFHEDCDVLLSDYGLLKVSEEAYNSLDKEGILAVKKTSYGYDFLSNNKQFYLENYPTLAIENIGIDDVLKLMSKE